jgi:hypothetical protein
MSDFYGHLMGTTREPKTRPQKRCCAHCKTPYGCANPACRCHHRKRSAEQLVAEQAEARKEQK